MNLAYQQLLGNGQFKSGILANSNPTMPVERWELSLFKASKKEECNDNSISYKL